MEHNEFHEDLKKFAAKHHLKKVILILEEESDDTKTKEQTEGRAVIFIPEKYNTENQVPICDLAHMLDAAITQSKVMTEIIKHANDHALQEALVDHLLPHAAKRVD